MSADFCNKVSIATKKAMKCTKHHVNLNRNDNNKDNIILLPMSNHSKLHLKSYEYLVECGEIAKYIKWFDKKYGLNKITQEENNDGK